MHFKSYLDDVPKKSLTPQNFETSKSSEDICLGNAKMRVPARTCKSSFTQVCLSTAFPALTGAPCFAPSFLSQLFSLPVRWHQPGPHCRDCLVVVGTAALDVVYGGTLLEQQVTPDSNSTKQPRPLREASPRVICSFYSCSSTTNSQFLGLRQGLKTGSLQATLESMPAFLGLCGGICACFIRISCQH